MYHEALLRRISDRALPAAEQVECKELLIALNASHSDGDDFLKDFLKARLDAQVGP